MVAICIEYTESAVDAERAGEALAEVELGSGDVVVLCDPRTAVLTPVIRDYGGHAVWAFGARPPSGPSR